MSSSPSASDDTQEPTADELARIESGRRLVSYMLVGMGVGVVGVIAFGLYKLVMIVVENS